MYLKAEVLNMKKSGKKLLATVLMGVSIFAAGAIANPPTSYAYYADTSSVVYQGTNNGMRYGAVNVVDDDGTVYTFYFKYKPYSDISFYRVAGDSTWHDWPTGKHVVYSHVESLAFAGIKALWAAVR